MLVVSRVLHPALADPRFAYRNMGQTKRRRKGRMMVITACGTASWAQRLARPAALATSPSQ